MEKLVHQSKIHVVVFGLPSCPLVSLESNLCYYAWSCRIGPSILQILKQIICYKGGGTQKIQQEQQHVTSRCCTFLNKNITSTLTTHGQPLQILFFTYAFLLFDSL